MTRLQRKNYRKIRKIFLKNRIKFLVVSIKKAIKFITEVGSGSKFNKKWIQTWWKHLKWTKPSQSLNLHPYREIRSGKGCEIYWVFQEFQGYAENRETFSVSNFQFVRLKKAAEQFLFALNTFSLKNIWSLFQFFEISNQQSVQRKKITWG